MNNEAEMFPSVTHMIEIRRSKKELRDLAKHTVQCWLAVDRVSEGTNMACERLYDGVTKAHLADRARQLVRHCLDKPVSTD